MSRSLAPLALVLAILAGCATSPPTPPNPVVETTPPEITAYLALHQWLNLQQQVAALGTEEVVAELVSLGKPEDIAQLYYYGLLNQQLQTYGGWAQARDTFRELHLDEELLLEQRQMAGILQQYNQNRINWHQRQSELLKQYAELKLELQQAEQDKLLLEQKIQALTDLETVISTRKEQ